MKILFLAVLPILLNGCAALQPIADDVEKMETDNAVTIKIQKEGMNKDTNLHIDVDVINSEEKENKL